MVSGKIDFYRVQTLQFRRVGGRIQAGERGLARGQLRDGGDHQFQVLGALRDAGGGTELGEKRFGLRGIVLSQLIGLLARLRGDGLAAQRAMIGIF